MPYNSEYQIPEILKTNEQMKYKLNVRESQIKWPVFMAHRAD